MSYKTKYEDLLKRYNEKDWVHSSPNKSSKWFFLVNTNVSEFDFPEARTYLREAILEFTQKMQTGEFIAFNKPKHKWSADIILNINIMYVIEVGRGKLTKTGELAKNTINKLHAHIIIEIRHKSNISLKYDDIKTFFKDFLEMRLDKTPFIGKPKWIAQDLVTQYIEKSYETGCVWENVNI